MLLECIHADQALSHDQENILRNRTIDTHWLGGMLLALHYPSKAGTLPKLVKCLFKF